MKGLQVIHKGNICRVNNKFRRLRHLYLSNLQLCGFLCKARKANFRKTVDGAESRRRRTDTSLKLRKDKKIESLNKRRTLTNSTPIVANSSDTLGAVATNTSNRRVYTASDIPELMAVLQRYQSGEANIYTEDGMKACLGVTKGFRRMLSVEKNPPVLPVLDCGVVPMLVQMLNMDYTCGNSLLFDLQFEATWALTNVASTDYSASVLDAGAVPPLVRLLSSPHPESREQAAWCLGNIAGDSTRLRDAVIKDGVIPPLLMNVSNPANNALLGNVIWSLSNMCRGKPLPDFEATKICVPELARVLKYYQVGHNLEEKHKDVLVDAAWALSYLSDGNEDRIQAVLDTGCVPVLMQHLDNSFNQREPKHIVTPVVRVLGNFVSGSDSQTQAVIDGGMIERAQQLLRNPRKNVRKETCWLLSNIAAGTQSQITSLFQFPSLLQNIVQLAEKAEWEVRKEALWVLSNIATGGQPEHVEGITELGAIRAVVSMLTVPDSKVIIVALDALTAILKVGENLNNNQAYVVLVEEANGVESLEELQEHKNDEVYQKTIGIIEQFFAVEDEEDENLAPSHDGEAFTFGVQDTKVFNYENYGSYVSPFKDNTSSAFSPAQQLNFTSV